MDVVEKRAVGGQGLGEGRGTRELDAVPPDVGQAQTGGAQRRHFSRDQAESGGGLELSRALEEQVHPQADPEHGQAGHATLDDHITEAELVQVAHRPREGADAGHDEAIRACEHVAIASDRSPRPDVLECLFHRATIAHPVVDDGDLRTRGHAVSVPFVLGTPCSVGSSATAARSARAKALKAASIM